jgi:hypothetical protein
MQAGKLAARERMVKMNVYSIAVRERKIEYDLNVIERTGFTALQGKNDQRELTILSDLVFLWLSCRSKTLGWFVLVAQWSRRQGDRVLALLDITVLTIS